MNKLRVGVLMGGTSIEREVSFNSGRTVCDHLDTALYTVLPLFQDKHGTLYHLPWHFLHRGTIADFEHRLVEQAQSISWDQLKECVDFVYIAMHGYHAEDGVLQGTLETLGIPYLGSDILSSALGMDKYVQKEILALAGITVPRCIAISTTEIDHYALDQSALQTLLTQADLALPVVVKPRFEGSSLGVSVVDTYDQLIPALRTAAHATQHTNKSILIEEKIRGMEFSCVLLFDGDKHDWIALPPTEIEYIAGKTFFDYEQKYMPGKALEHTPARCSHQLQTVIQNKCITAARALDFSTIARIDGFLTASDEVVIVDPNSFSGLAPASFLFREAAHVQMNHPQVINHLIKTELKQYPMLTPITAYSESQTTQKDRLKIAVLFGGDSNEREISLESGRNVVYKLSQEAYDVTPLFVNNQMQLYKLNQQLLVRSNTSEIDRLVTADMHIAWSDLPGMVDFVFIALHGGKGENGSVQGMLEMLHLPYNGSSVMTSALCMNKYKTNQLLRHKGFHVPASLLITKEEWSDSPAARITTIEQTIGYPVIIKPHDDGCSTMVHKATSSADVASALETLFMNGKTHALIEECITGMELTVGVIGNTKAFPLVPSQSIARRDILSIEEKFLPGAGENQTPAPLPTKTLAYVRATMAEVYTALGCSGYARIDCFYQDANTSPTGVERLVIIEINTLPALTPATCIFHQAAELGINPRQFMKILVSLGLEKHNTKLPFVEHVNLDMYISYPNQ